MGKASSFELAHDVLLGGLQASLGFLVGRQIVTDGSFVRRLFVLPPLLQE